jgi:hypothetical protein
MTVGQLHRDMGAKEFNEWVAFYKMRKEKEGE